MEPNVTDAIGVLWPAAQPYLAVVLPLQLLARALEPLTRRKHSTWINTGLRYLAAFPGSPARLPASPVPPG